MSQSSSSSMGFGYVPTYPSSIVFSNCTIINSILSDVPYLITGLLGFATLTFFLIVRQSNRYLWILAFAVACEFLAAVFDLDQLLQRGEFAVQTGTDVLVPFVIVREVMLSLAPGFFFFFFWLFVALPPRGELQPPASDQPYSRTLGILNYPNAYHCGRWNRWGLLGMFLQWTILSVVFAVPALQMAWRISAFDIPFGTIYNASATTEILLSCLFILKINGNVWLSNLGEKWRTFRDYTPILFCLVLGLGIRVGNVEIFQFSESPLGRFLQAVETYMLFLYVLCASFYPSSNSETPTSSGASLFADPENGSVRKFNMQFKTNDKGQAKEILSPEIVPTTSEPEIEKRHSAAHILGNPTSKYRSPGEETLTSTSGTSSAFTKLQIDDRRRPSPKTASSWADSSLAVVIPEDNISPASRFYPPSVADSSPVYGLNGIVRGSPVPSSINSRTSDLSSLYRRQAELDKSVAGLLRYSKNSRNSKSPADSDFSLSNFPEPPIVRASFDTGASRNSNGDLILGNTTFALVPPSILFPASHGRQASVPFSLQGSEDGLVVGGRDRFPSNATRYDVTSFIGGYAVPENAPSSPMKRDSSEASTKSNQGSTANERDMLSVGNNPSVLKVPQVRRGQDPPFISPLNPNRLNNINKAQPVQRLEISRPQQLFSVEDELAFERPRDAPIVGGFENSLTV